MALLSRNMLYTSILNNHVIDVSYISFLHSRPPPPPCCPSCEGEIVPCFWSYYICSAVLNTWIKTDTQSNNAFGYWNNDRVSRDIPVIRVILKKLLVCQLFYKCHSFHFHRNVIRHSSQEHVKTCFFSEVSFPFAHVCIAVLHLQIGMWLVNAAIQRCQNSKLISKVKQTLLQTLTGPEGTRRFRLADFMTISTWEW